MMSQLIVRKVDPEVVRRLKQRAASHGRSMEAEHRALLGAALLDAQPERSLKELLLVMPDVGDDADFTRPEDRARRVKL